MTHKQSLRFRLMAWFGGLQAAILVAVVVFVAIDLTRTAAEAQRRTSPHSSTRTT